MVDIIRGKLIKWSLGRAQNVNTVYNLFGNNKTLVERLNDNREFNLVILREDYFKELVSYHSIKINEGSSYQDIIRTKDALINALNENIRLLKSNL